VKVLLLWLPNTSKMEERRNEEKERKGKEGRNEQRRKEE
jgi:hypothetical protein